MNEKSKKLPQGVKKKKEDNIRSNYSARV